MCITHTVLPPSTPQVRDAQLSQYNYILVLGEQEQREGTVNIRTRDNIVHGMHRCGGMCGGRGTTGVEGMSGRDETCAPLT